MVFLPQFVNPARGGSIPLQLLTLGSVLAVLGVLALIFHAVLGVGSGKLAARLSPGVRAVRFFGGVHAGVFVGLAARLLLLERPAAR